MSPVAFSALTKEFPLRWIFSAGSTRRPVQDLGASRQARRSCRVPFCILPRRQHCLHGSSRPSQSKSNTSSLRIRSLLRFPCRLATRCLLIHRLRWKYPLPGIPQCPFTRRNAARALYIDSHSARSIGPGLPLPIPGESQFVQNSDLLPSQPPQPSPATLGADPVAQTGVRLGQGGYAAVAKLLLEFHQFFQSSFPVATTGTRNRAGRLRPAGPRDCCGPDWFRGHVMLRLVSQSTPRLYTESGERRIDAMHLQKRTKICENSEKT